jgi:hypothetical protein
MEILRKIGLFQKEILRLFQIPFPREGQEPKGMGQFPALS